MLEYKIMKVFKITYMPDEARKNIAKKYHGTSNDVFVKWDVFPIGKYEDELKENDDIIYKIECPKRNVYFVRGDDPVSDWLYENGATPHEEVIIEYSW